MSKGKSKTGSRSGSDSNNASRASASDRKHDKKAIRENKSIKMGAGQSRKANESQSAGGKRET